MINGVKKYVALVSQSGSDAPTASELENSLGGTIVWSYISNGHYRGTLTGAFPDVNKFWATPSAGSNDTVGASIGWNDANSFDLYETFGDDGLINYSIEIRVYP